LLSICAFHDFLYVFLSCHWKIVFFSFSLFHFEAFSLRVFAILVMISNQIFCDLGRNFICGGISCLSPYSKSCWDCRFYLWW